jgi:hypothetical protein
MAGLVAKILINEVWVEVGSRETALVGTPLTSHEAAIDAIVLSDSYRLTFSNVIPGVSSDVLVTTGSSANPYDQTSISVNLDASTEHLDLIPGVTLIFSDDPEFDDTWEVTLLIGVPFGLVNAFPPESGSASNQTRIQVENTGSRSGSSCFVTILNIVKRVVKVGSVFQSMEQFSEDAESKITLGVTSPYLVEVSNVSGIGPAKTMDLDIDGSPVDVTNLSSGIETSSVGLNVVDAYRVTSSGDLEGVEFKLSEDASNGDQENVLVFDSEYVQIAADTEGDPSDWGIEDVTLTEVDQSDGVITASGVAYFHIRLVVGEFGNKLSNPYPCSVAIKGSAIADAGWTA